MWPKCSPSSAFRVKWLGEVYQMVWIAVRAEVVSKQPKILENPRGRKIISIYFLVLYPKNLIGCKGCGYKMESCSLANLKYECSALKVWCCWDMMVPAEGTHLQGAREGTIEDTVFVLSNLICSQEEIMPTAEKCLESIFRIPREGALLVLWKTSLCLDLHEVSKMIK